jgi:FMN phosphatase YigB (HAD superfamily)
MSLDYLIDQLSRGRTLIFDLDNTIYPESDFLFGVYFKISLIANPKANSEVFDFLKATFISEGRKNIFGKLIDKYPESKLTEDICLTIMRSYKPTQKIKPFAWFTKFICQVNKSFVLRIVTNGNVVQQANKINSIDFRLPMTQVDVVYANQIRPKPAPDSFLNFKNVNDFIDPIYIGDSFVDAEYAHNLGIEFVDSANLIN